MVVLGKIDKQRHYVDIDWTTEVQGIYHDGHVQTESEQLDTYHVTIVMARLA
jgi:hypothetical protein